MKNLENSFSKTSLDLESKSPLGGPNRTNADNIVQGTYTNNRSGNLYGKSVGGPLKDNKGKIINSMLSKYTPKSTYLDSFKETNFSERLKPQNQNNPNPIKPFPSNVNGIISQIPTNLNSGNQT
jgi:hypothetical protein